MGLWLKDEEADEGFTCCWNCRELTEAICGIGGSSCWANPEGAGGLIGEGAGGLMEMGVSGLVVSMWR